MPTEHMHNRLQWRTGEVVEQAGGLLGVIGCDRDAQDAACARGRDAKEQAFWRGKTRAGRARNLQAQLLLVHGRTMTHQPGFHTRLQARWRPTCACVCVQECEVAKQAAQPSLKKLDILQEALGDQVAHDVAGRGVALQSGGVTASGDRRESQNNGQVRHMRMANQQIRP